VLADREQHGASHELEGVFGRDQVMRDGILERIEADASSL